MSTLWTISYTSTAVGHPTGDQIAALLTKARARNEAEGVTGVLLHTDGTFHQYIEGPIDGVERVYASIARDPLHHHLFEMIREPAEHREFDRWAMGYRGTQSLAGVEDETALNDLLADESVRLTPGRLLLNAFWNKGLGRRYQAALQNRR